MKSKELKNECRQWVMTGGRYSESSELLQLATWVLQVVLVDFGLSRSVGYSLRASLTREIARALPLFLLLQ